MERLHMLKVPVDSMVVDEAVEVIMSFARGQ